jgi:hypothetical protein
MTEIRFTPETSFPLFRLRNNVASLPFFYKLLIRRHNYMRLKIRWSPPRLIWSDYVAELTHQNELNRTFWTSLTLFNKLSGPVATSTDGWRVAISPYFEWQETCHAQIGCCNVVAMVSRWPMARHKESQPFYFCFLWLKFIHAVMASPVLEITLSDSSEISAL